MGFVLASASPRRKELLELAGLDFKMVVSAVDESLVDKLSPTEQVARLAMKKAKAVAEAYHEETVIGADTIVVLDEEILGKPVDKDDAISMLSRLSGNWHEVLTAVAIVNTYRKITAVFVNVTKVKFYELGEEWLRAYVETGEPMDKAGSYGIQGLGFELVEKIEGDFYSVMGFPISQLKRELKKLGLI